MTAEAETKSLSRLRALERGLVRVRWFGIAFAFFQIFMGRDPACPPGAVEPQPCEPGFLRPSGYGLAAGLALFNLLVMWWVGRSESKGLRRLGAAVFLADHIFLIAYSFLYSHYKYTTIWIMLYILPLEGALRWGMRGALTSLGILGAAEAGRDFYRLAVWGHEFALVPDTTFRVGIMAIIALVSGMLARNLQRERLEVERRAQQLSGLAERETAARRELQAFHVATLAGVSTGDFDEAMQRMISKVGELFGFPSLAVALLEEHPTGPRMRVVAGYRYPRETIGKTFSLDEGVSGSVAKTGVPALVPDVSKHPSYLEWASWSRSEMVVPLKVGERIVGVLNVESPVLNAFDESHLDQLVRLASGLAVVVENARILATEQEAVQRLMELDEMKSDFISITSHELRTPLTSIRGFIRTLRRSELQLTKEQIDEYLQVIDRASERLQRAVEDLLFVSQVEAGALEHEDREVVLDDLLASLIREHFPGDVERIIVRSPGGPHHAATDPARFGRVVDALIDNALKFSPPLSEVAVTVRSVGLAVELEVADQGIGIPQEDIERIFDRFYQVGGSMKRHQHGFGLGLYICRRIVVSLGAEIRVSSVPARGSTFTVTLPRQPLPSRPGPLSQSIPSSSASTNAPGSNG